MALGATILIKNSPTNQNLKCQNLTPSTPSALFPGFLHGVRWMVLVVALGPYLAPPLLSHRRARGASLVLSRPLLMLGASGPQDPQKAQMGPRPPKKGEN